MTNNHTKPKLTIEEQIRHLRFKGIKFEKCSELDAAEYLSKKNNYFRLASFRKLFPKFTGIKNNGRYIDLDFFQLQHLSYLDQDIRSVLLSMSLDIEHYEKVKIIDKVTTRENEDGYSIVKDYRDSLNEKRQKDLTRELSIRESDIYCGTIIRKYGDDMPVWVFLEVIPFGRFIDYCRFCAERWGDKTLLDEHYLLKRIKSIRNATAHGSCLINGFAEKSTSGIELSYEVRRAVSKMGIPKSTWKKRLANDRMNEIATLFFLYYRLVPAGESRSKASGILGSCLCTFEGTEKLYAENSVIVSCMLFIRRLTENFNLS